MTSETAVTSTPDDRRGTPLFGYAAGIERILPDFVDPFELPNRREDQCKPMSEWLGPAATNVAYDLTAFRALMDHLGTAPRWQDVRTDEERNQLDGWLAPRLHASLRLPRRLASSNEFWSWLTLEHGATYQLLRFGRDDGTVARWRYVGSDFRNGLSRLWWGAEMSRSGGDRSVTPHVFARTRTAQFALELHYSHRRDAVIAFTEVAEGLDGGERLSDSRMKSLSTALNASLPLRTLEGVVGPSPATPRDAAWWSAVPRSDEVVSDVMPSGPTDGLASPEGVERLVVWLRELAERAK